MGVLDILLPVFPGLLMGPRLGGAEVLLISGIVLSKPEFGGYAFHVSCG